MAGQGQDNLSPARSSRHDGSH
ncbi:hypothetical protein A2U01_0085305, partial [Trifolium medium]|nr:hypothetical protein [Trifolium medium]